MVFGFLPLSMAHIATFSIHFPWITWDSHRCYLYGSLTTHLTGSGSPLWRDSPDHPAALEFCRHTDGRLTFIHLLDIFLFAVLDCFVVGVKALLFGNDGLYCPYFSLYGCSYHLDKFFKFSLRFLVSLVRSCGGSNEHFDALWNYARHTLQYRTLSILSFDSSLTTVRMEWIGNATPASFTAITSILFRCTTIEACVAWRSDVVNPPFATIWFKIFDLCQLLAYVWCCFLSRADACSFVENMAWYASSFTGAFLWLLKTAPILGLEDCGSPSTKITLSTNLQ